MQEKINMNEVVEVYARICNSLQDSNNEVEKLFKLCGTDEKYYTEQWEKISSELSSLADDIRTHIFNEAVADECASIGK